MRLAYKIVMLDTTNTTDLAALVALDSLEANGLGHIDTRKLMIGLPATVSIACDHYAAIVVKTTACTITAQTLDSDKPRTFRMVRGAWRSKHWILSLGAAEQRLDECR